MLCVAPYPYARIASTRLLLVCQRPNVDFEMAESHKELLSWIKALQSAS